MNVSPFVFKTRAVRALKGNWQTALLVSFFASLPMTVVQLLQVTRLPDLTLSTSYESMMAAINAVTDQTWMLLGLVSGLSLVLTPVLAIGCNAYFIERLRGREPGFKGLFSRLNVSVKALLLYALIALKVFLWSLLLVVPGIIAMLRYSMAPFYLAEEPDIGVLEAMRRSKAAMKERKLTYLILELSFLWWLVGALLCDSLLAGISPILGLVVSQFIQLVMAAYLNAACAGFYLAVSVPGGMERAQAEATRWLQRMGAERGVGGIYHRPFGNDDVSGTADDSPADPSENAPDDLTDDSSEDPSAHGGDETLGGDGQGSAEDADDPADHNRRA